MRKHWRVLDTGGSAGVATEDGSHPVLHRLLRTRGVEKDEEKDGFLNPDWDKGIFDPFLFTQMPRAIERIFQALEGGEKITVHGDYDADGVTGSAVVINALREVQSKLPENQRTAVIDSYIPHRDKEGYGVNLHTVDLLKEGGTNLIITVDCGISCVKEVAKAKELGIDTIVVDHHQFGDELPDGILIHPKIPGETYPCPHLAAVGVSWKLACGLFAAARKRGLEIPPGAEKWLLDFVSIATVTDMVPLVGENRVLETYGLKVLNKTRRPGLQYLVQVSGEELGKLDTQSVGFSLGPRINAAGRMDHASLALRLMLAESEEEASVLAAELESKNRERQKVTASMMEEAESQLDNSAPILVFASPTWSPALVGLVAGKYMERYGKPVVAIGKHGENWIGSGRSFAAYDITEAVKRAGENILTRAGGHVQACGFSFTDDALLPEFVRRLKEDAAKHLKIEECVPVLPIDAEVSLAEIDWKLLDAVNLLEPYGEGNRKPIFMARDLEVLTCDLMGLKQNHARCVFRAKDGHTGKFVAFNVADRLEEMKTGNKIDVAFEIRLNEWNGRKEIQCRLVDLREAAV